MLVRHALLVGINRYPNLPQADLRGCINDVDLMRNLLAERFGFREDTLEVLRDEEASRDAILDRMNAITERIGSGDIVVFFYAGHGSRVVDSGAYFESIVPADSGHDTKPNRDILDFEIDGWIQRLNHVTPFVTLVMDCCHSGSVTRDAFGERVRALPSDPRGLAAWTGTQRAAKLRLRGLREGLELAGWVAGRRRAVVLAACRASELAWEHRWFDGVKVRRNGAFSFFLGRALAQAAPGTTWRDLFECLAPAINREVPAQHPLAEGKVDEELFGRAQAPPSSYLTVLSVRADQVALSGGAAHGVRVGSRWQLVRSQVEGANDTTGGTLEIARIDSTSSLARGDWETCEGTIQGQRAILVEDVVDPELYVVVPEADNAACRYLRTLVDEEPLLLRIDDRDRADVAILRIAARVTLGQGDPLPGLGPLAAPQWAVLGRDGDLAAPLVAATDNDVGEIEQLVRMMVSIARFRALLAIDNPSAGALRGQVQMRALPAPCPNGLDHGRRRALGNHPRAFLEGDRTDFEITNVGSTNCYVSLLEFGVDYAIRLLAPYSGHPTYRLGGEKGGQSGGIPLAGGTTFSVRNYYDQDPARSAQVRGGLYLSLPSAFPWSTASAQSCGQIYLKLIVTAMPADFEFLRRPAARALHRHPLERLLHRCAAGSGSRSFAASLLDSDPTGDWTTVTLALNVRR